MSLTRQVRHRRQLLRPVLGDLDRLMFHRLTLGRHPLLVGVVHDLLEVVRIQGVEDIEEVLARWSLAGWVFVRKV